MVSQTIYKHKLSGTVQLMLSRLTPTWDKQKHGNSSPSTPKPLKWWASYSKKCRKINTIYQLRAKVRLLSSWGVTTNNQFASVFDCLPLIWGTRTSPDYMRAAYDSFHAVHKNSPDYPVRKWPEFINGFKKYLCTETFHYRHDNLTKYNRQIISCVPTSKVVTLNLVHNLRKTQRQNQRPCVITVDVEAVG